MPGFRPMSSSFNKGNAEWRPPPGETRKTQIDPGSPGYFFLEWPARRPRSSSTQAAMGHM
jgi:hypothetical protein